MASPWGAALTALGQGLPQVGAAIADIPEERKKRALLEAQLANFAQEQRQAQNKAEREAAAREAVSSALKELSTTGTAAPAENQVVSPNTAPPPDMYGKLFPKGSDSVANVNKTPLPDMASGIAAAANMTPPAQEVPQQAANLGNLIKPKRDLFSVAQEYADTDIGKTILANEARKANAEEERDFRKSLIPQETAAKIEVANAEAKLKPKITATGPGAEKLKNSISGRDPIVRTSGEVDNFNDVLELLNGKVTGPVLNTITQKIGHLLDPTAYGTLQAKASALLANPKQIASTNEIAEIKNLVKTQAAPRVEIINAQLAGYTPNLHPQFQLRIDRYNKLSGAGGGDNINLTGDKAARLAELRAKKASGSIQ